MSQSEGKVFPGQPFHPPPAIIWNNMVDAGRAWADGRFNSPPGNPNRSRQTDLIKIKNSSGGNRAQGEVLKISGKVIEQVDDEFIWLDGVEPTADCRFGILKHPLLIDEVDTAQVSGVTIAKVNVTSVDHTFADVEDGEYLLQSADEGPLEILFMPDGTDPIPEGGETRECVVRFAGSSFRTRSAKLVTDLDAVDDPFGEPSTGRAVLYQKAEDGTLAPTLDSQGEDMEVDVEWRLDFSLEANQYVQLEHINGAWSPYVSSCSPVEGSSSS